MLDSSVACKLEPRIPRTEGSGAALNMSRPGFLVSVFTRPKRNFIVATPAVLAFGSALCRDRQPSQPSGSSV